MEEPTKRRMGQATPTPRAIHDAARSMQVDALTTRAVRELEEASVPSLLLRGPAIATWLYSDPATRTYTDADLLVPPEQRETARRALEKLHLAALEDGMAPAERAPHAETFVSPEGGAVDLHWTLRGVNADPGEVWRVLSENPDRITLGSTDVPIARVGARALIVALHAAQHSREDTAHEDLARALSRLPAETWGEAAEIADILAARTAFAAGLGRFEQGQELLTTLAFESSTPDAQTTIRAEGQMPLALGVAKLAETQGLRPKLALLGRELFPTPAYMRVWWPPARRGRIALAIGYLVRPFWLAWRLLPAIRLYRRASRPNQNHSPSSGTEAVVPKEEISPGDEEFAALFFKSPEFSPGETGYGDFVRFNLGAVDRGREVASQLGELRDLSGAKVLDVGAGTGGLSIAFAERGAEVWAVEPDARRQDWLHARAQGHGVEVHLVRGAAEKLDFADGSFDVVLMDSVIEHVENPDAVVREVTRVLGPDGLVYLTSPNKWSFLLLLHDPHYRMFGVVLMPRWLGRFYIERIRRSGRPYWVNVIPTQRWLQRAFARGGVELERQSPEGIEKLSDPTSIGRHRWIRPIAHAARALGATGLLRRVVTAQHPALISVGTKRRAGR